MDFLFEACLSFFGTNEMAEPFLMIDVHLPHGSGVRARIAQEDLVAPSPVHRSALKSERARHTALTNIFTGRPARIIVNRAARELGPINPAAPAFPLATAAMAPLRAKAEARESSDFSPIWSGQNASGCRELPAAHLLRELARGLG